MLFLGVLTTPSRGDDGPTVETRVKVALALSKVETPVRDRVAAAVADAADDWLVVGLSEQEAPSPRKVLKPAEVVMPPKWAPTTFRKADVTEVYGYLKDGTRVGFYLPANAPEVMVAFKVSELEAYLKVHYGVNDPSFYPPQEPKVLPPEVRAGGPFGVLVPVAHQPTVGSPVAAEVCVT